MPISASPLCRWLRKSFTLLQKTVLRLHLLDGLEHRRDVVEPCRRERRSTTRSALMRRLEGDCRQRARHSPLAVRSTNSRSDFGGFFTLSFYRRCRPNRSRSTRPSLCRCRRNIAERRRDWAPSRRSASRAVLLADLDDKIGAGNHDVDRRLVGVRLDLAHPLVGLPSWMSAATPVRLVKSATNVCARRPRTCPHSLSP